MTNLLFICGSPRKAATEYVMLQAKEAAETVEDTKVTMLNLRSMKFSPCVGCNACVKQGKTECVIYQDDMQEWNRNLFKYDGILIGSPVYDMGVTPQLAAFFSRFRAEYLNQKNDPFIRMYQPGAALAVGGARNGGQETVVQIIHGFYHTQGMPIVNGGIGTYGGAAVWSHDRMAQGAAEDEQGIDNVRLIGKKLALTAAALKATRSILV